jgi:hypothetical protein
VRINQNCEVCPGVMEAESLFATEIGDKLVCNRKDCDFQSTITCDYMLVRDPNVVLLGGSTEKVCEFCLETADVSVECMAYDGKEIYDFCKSCLVGLVLENL